MSKIKTDLPIIQTSDSKIIFDDLIAKYIVKCLTEGKTNAS